MPKGLLTSLAVGAAGVAAGTAIAYRRWAAQPEDETTAFGVLSGTDSVVESPDGTHIAVTDNGPKTGRPVVLIHGWTEDRRVWKPVAARLIDSGARVIAYDQRGHGSSGVGGDGYSIDALANDLRAVLEGLDLRDTVVVGHSMGGMAAQAFAGRHPEVLAERVAGLVLVSTAAADIGLGGRAERPAARLMSSPLFQRTISHPTIGPLLTRGAVGRKPTIGHLRATAEMLAGTSVATRTGFLSAMGTMDLTAQLGLVKLPVTVVVGSRDQLTPLRAGQHIASLVEGARLEVVPGAGHQLPLEAPDLVSRLILDVPDRSALDGAAVHLAH
jgi:non-heme chloroperoxidase